MTEGNPNSIRIKDTDPAFPAVLTAVAFTQAGSFLADVHINDPKRFPTFATFFGLSYHLAGIGNEAYEIYRREMTETEARKLRVGGLGLALAGIKSGERSCNPVPMPLQSQVERVVWDYMNSGDNALLDIATTANQHISGHREVVEALEEARNKQIEMQPFVAKLHSQAMEQ